MVYWRPPKPLDWPLVDDGRRTYCTIYQPSSAQLAVVNDSWCAITAIFQLFTINYFSKTFCKSLQNWSRSLACILMKSTAWAILRILTFVTTFSNLQYSIFSTTTANWRKIPVFFQAAGRVQLLLLIIRDKAAE